MSDDVFKCLYRTSIINDDDGNVIVNENMFFNLFCNNEYMYDTYNTNKLKHFEIIFQENQFAMSVIGDKDIKLTRIDKTIMKCLTEQISIDNFNKFLEDDDKEKEEYKIINDRLKYLEIPLDKNDVLTKYKDIINDNIKTEEHKNVIRPSNLSLDF